MPAGTVVEPKGDLAWTAIKVALKTGEMTLRQALRHPASADHLVWDIVALSRLTGEYGPTAAIAHQVMKDMREQGMGPLTRAAELTPGAVLRLVAFNRRALHQPRPL